MWSLSYLSLALCLVHHALRVSLFLPATVPFIASVHAPDTSAASQMDDDSSVETPSVSADVQTSQSVSNTREWPITNFEPLSKPPKYFAIDIDGTFLATDTEVMKRNLDAFEKALKAGYNLFFCTGRDPQGLGGFIPEDVFKRTGFTGYPGVYQNGATVYDSDGQLLLLAHFPAEVVSRIVEIIKEAAYDSLSAFTTKDTWHILTKNAPYLKAMANMLKLDTSAVRHSTADQIKDEKIVNIVFLKYEGIADKFKDMDGTDFVVKRTYHGITAITPIGVTKGSGLEVLLRGLNIEASDCGYVGDADNDIEAMQMVEHSFAVGDAEVAVKAAAKYVVQQTHEEGAFATVMNAVYGIDEE